MYDLMWQDAQRWKASGGVTPIPAAPADPAVRAAAVLMWEEHCVECAIPECYTSCPLYVARRDQKCARFEYGIYPNRDVAGLFPFGADVRFRRWGKLEAQFPGRPRLIALDALRRYAGRERLIERSANLVSDILQPVNPKRRFNGLVTFVRTRQMAEPAEQSAAPPDALFVKFHSPDAEPGELVIEAWQERRLVYRDGIPFTQGWNERSIPFARLQVDPSKSVRLLASPANDQPARLVFTWLDLVQYAARPATVEKVPANGSGPAKQQQPAAKIKCVVWDLDNTLWEGVIGDLGAEGVKPAAAVLEMIRALDQRGVIQSVASKNDYEVAWPKLEQLGLADYLLYPAIHWGPKSQSLVGIAEKLNINIDTFALVDDSAFERGEVSQALPQVRVYDPVTLADLLGRPEFDLPITEMSAKRRLSYLAEAQRQRVEASFTGDHETFLRSCGMVMRISTPHDAQVARCLELVQRTNQLNLSSRRYNEAEFRQLLADPKYECFAFDCADRFGEYGLVGFASVDISGDVPVLRDFVLSCRVAQKRVEEAFVYWYAARAQARGARTLRAVFVPTDRNRPLREAMAQLPFVLTDSPETAQVYEMSLAQPVAAPDIVRVEAS